MPKINFIFSSFKKKVHFDMSLMLASLMGDYWVVTVFIRLFLIILTTS